MSREFCLGQVARITELEKAVAELQKLQSKGLWLENTQHPIQPPTEQSTCQVEQDKCKSCKHYPKNLDEGDRCWGKNCDDNYSAYEPKEDVMMICDNGGKCDRTDCLHLSKHTLRDTCGVRGLCCRDFARTCKPVEPKEIGVRGGFLLI